MLGTLDVLVVDDQPDSVRFLVDFLSQRCHRVDMVTCVRDANAAVERRRQAKEPYQLVISDFAMPEADGLALLRGLRHSQDDVPFIFATGYRSLNPAFEPEAKSLGVLAILDKPFDLRQVEELLTRATGIFQRKREQQGNEPFFGTSRTMRRPTGPQQPPTTEPSEALEPRAPGQAKPLTATWRNPDLDAHPSALEPLQPGARGAPPPPAPAPAVPISGYQRRPSAIVPMTGGTARLRRSVSPVPPSAPGTARLGRSSMPQPPTAFTARVRRGIEGTASFTKAGAEPEAQRMVPCTICNTAFLTPRKNQVYTTVCVHCGQLQRIEPE